MKPKLSPIEKYFADIKHAFGLIEDSLLRHKAGLGDLGYEFLKQELDQYRVQVPSQLPHESEHGLSADNDNDIKSPKMLALTLLRQFSKSVMEQNDPMSSYSDPNSLVAVHQDVSHAMLYMMGEKGLSAVRG